MFASLPAKETIPQITVSNRTETNLKLIHFIYPPMLAVKYCKRHAQNYSMILPVYNRDLSNLTEESKGVLRIKVLHVLERSPAAGLRIYLLICEKRIRDAHQYLFHCESRGIY